jgi:C-terminal processing protease CtpA/Prc
MNITRFTMPVAAILLFAATAHAQTQETEEANGSAEQRKAEIEMQETEARAQMREAERQLAEAARQIAELSSQSLPRVVEMEKGMYDLVGKPRLGVTIGKGEEQGPVEGVLIVGVSPGSGADDAGLRTGDVITSVNDESLTADSTKEASLRLLDFMKGVEEGDKILVGYLRDGNVGQVEVEPRIVESHAFAWFGDEEKFVFPGMPKMHLPPDVAQKFRYVAPLYGSSWGDMELVELSEGLGRYFGTDRGLLVVNAPKSEAFKLQDGDVIQSIDGREPTSVGHAMRILSSYQPGEAVEIGIMREKQAQTLSIEMPDNRTGFVLPLPNIRPAAHALAPRPAAFIRVRPASFVEVRT